MTRLGDSIQLKEFLSGTCKRKELGYLKCYFGSTFECMFDGFDQSSFVYKTFFLELWVFFILDRNRSNAFHYEFMDTIIY